MCIQEYIFVVGLITIYCSNSPNVLSVFLVNCVHYDTPFIHCINCLIYNCL